MRTRVVNSLTVLATVPSVVLGLDLMWSDSGAIYNLVALLGAFLLVVCAVPLVLTVLSLLLDSRDVASALAVAAVGLVLALFLCLFSVAPALGLLRDAIV